MRQSGQTPNGGPIHTATAALAALLLLCPPTPARADAAPLAIQGPTKVEPYRLVELVAAGDVAGRALIWDVTPEEAADVRELPGGRLVFTGPPGVYKVKLRAIRFKDGVASVEAARHVVTVGQPAPPVPPGKADALGALGQIAFPIRLRDGREATSYCTATVVHPRRADGRWDILTAAHCVPAEGAAGRMVTRGGRSLAVTVARLDRTCDLCWLVTDQPHDGLPAATLARDNPAVGVPVWHQGYGVDQPGNREEGHVRAAEDGTGKVCFVLSVSSGDSGGGIFRADTNELVAAVCCTSGDVKRGDKVPMWAGSSRQAWRLRPQ